MPVKNFELVLPFQEYYKPDGELIYLPLVKVTITTTNSSTEHSLMFDTGAEKTILNSNRFPILGLSSWDEGEQVTVGGVGGYQIGYQYTFTLKIFEKDIISPIILLEIQDHPLIQGILGRDTIFNEFGFGFWESYKELYVTKNP